MTHIANFNSRLLKFYTMGKYTDITIECESESFKCHRLALAAASDCFDAMFGYIVEGIILTTTSAATFQQVLQFIYTGNASVTEANVLDLLRASELFQLSGIEDLCVQFVEQNLSTIPKENALEMFVFACRTKNQKLVDMLESFVVTRFEIFSHTSMFLEISFEDLKTILNLPSWQLLSKRNEESLLNAISRWIYHNREARARHSEELMNVIRFENISSLYMRDSDLTALTKPVQHHTVTKLQEGATSKTETSLHVFVKHPAEKLMRVYSVNSARICSVSSEIPLTDRSWEIRSVALDNLHLYCLNYSGNWEVEPTFCSHTSIDMRHPALQLQPPPIKNLCESVSMCGLQNNVYLLYSPSGAITRSSSSTSFTDEEISRGIYTYNSEVDCWLPVPKMYKQSAASSMTTCNDRLYVIGAQTRHMQTFDSRVGKWEKFPRASHKNYCRAVCCTVGGKIYVLDGRKGNAARRYDPRAGKWESIARINNSGTKINPRAVSYAEQMWIFERVKNRNLSIDVYCPEFNQWSTCPIIAEKCSKPGIVTEAVVFV